MIYASSDIHGYPLDRFLRLLEKAGFGEGDTLWILGDVVDRNGDGGVAMLRWIQSAPNVRMLLGNHEAMLLACESLFENLEEEWTEPLDDGVFRSLMHWLRNGASPTIQSLGRLGKEDPPALRALLDWLRSLKLYERVSAGGKEFLLVHSGLGGFSPEKKLEDYEPDELLWTRPDPEDRYFKDVITVLGHTPAGYRFGEWGKMFRTDTWIDIDTGASAGGAPMLLRLDDLKAFYADTK